MSLCLPSQSFLALAFKSFVFSFTACCTAPTSLVSWLVKLTRLCSPPVTLQLLTPRQSQVQRVILWRSLLLPMLPLRRLWRRTSSYFLKCELVFLNQDVIVVLNCFTMLCECWLVIPPDISLFWYFYGLAWYDTHVFSGIRLMLCRQCRK
jgi:hypothetical protein